VRKPTRPSIKDIAAAAGVSTAAVSYALNGNGRISVETKESVLKIANSIGFIKDDTAASLRTGKSNVLGVIVHDISNPFFAELLSDFESLCYEAGYLTIVANAKDDPARQATIIDALLAQNVAGLLISPSHEMTNAALSILRGWSKPFVVCVRDLGDDGADFVGVDDHYAGFLAAQYLIDCGIDCFGFIGGYDNTKIWRDRMDGINAALAVAATPLDRGLVKPCSPTREHGATAMGELLQDRPDCRAAICFNDYVAQGAYTAVHLAGKVIGMDYSLVGFDNLPLSSSLMPSLTTVDTYPREIGRLSALALLEALRLDKPNPRRHLVEPCLVIRNSVVGQFSRVVV